MQLHVTFRNLAPRDEIRRRGHALYDKLHRFLDMAADGHMVVGFEQHDAVCELVVTTRGQTFKGVERDADMRTAMDKVFHGVEEQLRRFKDRRTAYKARGRDPQTGFVAPDVMGLDA